MIKTPFHFFKTSPETIQLAVTMYVRFPLSLRNVEDLLDERGNDVCHESVRHWWNHFGPRTAIYPSDGSVGTVSPLLSSHLMRKRRMALVFWSIKQQSAGASQ